MNQPSVVTNDTVPESADRKSDFVVRNLSRGDERQWDEFVTKNPGGTFYHLSGWRSIIENELHHPTHYLYCEYGGEIQAVLPLAQVKSWAFGNALISIPFLVYGGVVSANDCAEKVLLSRARDLAERLRVDYLELRNRQTLEGNWLRKDAYVTFRKILDPDPEKNLLSIPRKQRAMIRKGMQAGLRAEVDDETNRLHAAMLECKRNLGTPFFGPDYFRAVKDEFGDQAEVLTVVQKNRLVCSVMSFRFRDEILPYYGGGGNMARSLKGNDFMYWALMEKACKDGIKVFDFGRSMIGTGAYRFKKHWGFEPTPLHYQYFLVGVDAVQHVSPSNPKYRTMINVWKRLPLPVAGLIGPPIARRLG